MGETFNTLWEEILYLPQVIGCYGNLHLYQTGGTDDFHGNHKQFSKKKKVFFQYLTNFILN